MSPDISSQEIVKAQVNYFKCGGVAISVCMWHVVADGPTAASFISTWAKIANNDGSGGGGGGELNDVGNVVYDCTTFFPPKDIKSLLMSNIKTEELLSNITMKRCVLDGAKISALREAVGNGPYLDRPTRVEAVGALIWKAVMDATGEEYVASIPVNLRNKMEPPLLKNCMGNINQVTFTTDCSLQDDYNCLAGKLHESIKKMDDEYVRKSHESGEYFEYVKNIAAGMTEDPKLLKMLGISSWCRFPFYESDFGWGKPVWVTPAMISRGVFLLDTKDGHGIEAWIGLPEEIMAKFEKDPRVCDYVSFTPN
ncbi:salutaridinol 7-O-acetyltransferase-like [Mercurialis annua]|uniref:salutaridinol 7-O-acetyltransferase-like n=1 Tax=Mercurialis annua TaxID=3986 RepID=UPI002160C632|nr:salutaridinol 7-O-acetyltransferase-like [Mercurialis annua]